MAGITNENNLCLMGSAAKMSGRGPREYLFDQGKPGVARRQTGRRSRRSDVACPAFRSNAILICRGHLDFVFHLIAWARKGDLDDRSVLGCRNPC